MNTNNEKLQFDLQKIKKLLFAHNYQECYVLIDSLLVDNQESPDLWMMKAVVNQGNPQTYNFCRMKAKSYSGEGYLVFERDDFSEMKAQMPEGWMMTNMDKENI